MLSRHVAQGQLVLAPLSSILVTDTTVDEMSLQTPDYSYWAEGCRLLELALKPWTENDMDRHWKQDFVGDLDWARVCMSPRGLKDSPGFVVVCCIVTAQVAENRLAVVEEKGVYRSQAAVDIEAVVGVGQDHCFVFGHGNIRLRLGEDSHSSAVGLVEEVFVHLQTVSERP